MRVIACKNVFPALMSSSVESSLTAIIPLLPLFSFHTTAHKVAAELGADACLAAIMDVSSEDQVASVLTEVKSKWGIPRYVNAYTHVYFFGYVYVPLTFPPETVVDMNT